MRKEFNPEDIELWQRYYADQASQTGYGLPPGFKGMPYQHGAGLGNFFRSLFKMAILVFKSIGSTVGKQALATGASVAADVAQGRPVLESLTEHGKEGAAQLLQKASESLQKGRGLGRRPKSIKGPDEPDIYKKQKRKNVIS